MTTFRTKAVRGIVYAIAAIIIFAAVTVSISRLLSPWLDSHRSDFEARASKLLDMPVTIQRIHVSWNIWRPQLTFEDINISDKTTHKSIFQIQRAHVRLSLLRSLLHWNLMLDRLKIDGVQINLHQQNSGTLWVDGLKNFPVENDIQEASPKTNAVILWILAQPDLMLDNIKVRFIPEKGQEKLYTLHRVDLTNTSSNHILRGQITLHQVVPTSANIALRWQGDSLDLSKVSAQIYMYIQAVSLPQWMKTFSWSNLEIRDGLGSAKIWMNWDHGQWQLMQTKFQVYELELYSSVTRQSQVISRLSGGLEWKRKGDTFEIAGDDILLDLPQHLWPTTHFTALLKSQPDKKYQLQSIHIGYLDLGDVKKFALASGLLPEQIKKWVIDFDPTGEALGLSLTLNSPTASFDNVTVFSGFSQLSFKENGKFPGIDNLSCVVSWNGKQGSIKLDSKQIVVKLDSLFKAPLRFNVATGEMQIQQDADQSWNLSAKNIEVNNADAKAQTNFTLKIPQHDSPVIDLTGNFSVNNGPRIIDYLPVKLWDASLRKWLDNAVLSGQVTDGTAVLQGKLSDFPFDQATGKFNIVGNFKDANLNFAPKWPILQHINGSLTFYNTSMFIDVNSGQVFDTQFKDIKGVIPYIGNDAPQFLSVQVAVDTDFNEGLKIIHQSPLQNTIGKDLANMNLTGPMQLKLDLSVPLGNPDDTSVAGDVITTNANLTLPEWKVSLDKMNGSFQFTEASLTADHIHGNLLNEPVDLTISTIHPAGQPGYVQVEMQSKATIPELQHWLGFPLDRVLTGAASYQAKLILPSHTQAKPAQISFTSDLYGVSVALPEPLGKKIDERKTFQLNLTALKGKISQVEVVLLNVISAVLNYQPNEKLLIVDLKGDRLAGRITLPLGSSEQPIVGRFRQVSFSSSDVQRNESKFNPAEIPALDIIADNVYFGEKNLGRIVLNSEPNKMGMNIKQFNIESRLMRLTARGGWRLSGNSNRTYLLGDIKIPNVSQLLNSWGFKSSNLVESGGNITFDLSWAKPPFNPTIKDMNGNISLQLTKGRIIDLGSSTDAKIDFGRMLNIFSLQTIPRRLSLDFSDLFEKGYSFDFMKGDFKLEGGNAYTHNARFDGPIARVDISGRVGLAGRNYDLTLGVTPYVTSSLPVVAGIAGGPLALIATWVADKVVTRTVSGVATYHYVVTGTWDSPVWKQVNVNRK